MPRKHPISPNRTVDSGSTAQQGISHSNEGILPQGILRNATTYDEANGILRQPDGRFIKNFAPISPGCPVKWTAEELDKISVDYIEWLLADKQNMFWYAFAKDRNINWAIWYEYYKGKMAHVTDDESAFSKVHEIERMIKEEKLQGNGLTGEWEARITALILKNKHGWAEKTEHTSNNRTINITIGTGKIPDTLPAYTDHQSLSEGEIPFQLLPPDQDQPPAEPTTDSDLPF